MSLFVVDPGWATRVVDGGRPASRSLGVPVGGAADRSSWMLGNALVGNPPAAAALEIAVKGPVLRADADIAGVVFGAPFELHSVRQELRAGRTFTLSAGEELHVGGTPSGMRAYLCVRGGFQAAEILGSRSALAPVNRGQHLPCATSRLRGRFVGPDCPFPTLAGPWRLRAVEGPQADWFAGQAWRQAGYTVTSASDRMGLRLDGPPLTLPKREMVSEPVCPGAVQVTNDGRCIILGIDGQTIGGYPKIAQIIRADLDALGQMRPGDALGFELVELSAAVDIQRQREAALREWLTRLHVSLAG
jgi:biotin-dependent carboxylase-like uncharacterized protein